MKDKPVILVVDDQPQNIELLEAYLVPQGYEIVKAANGEEALGKLSDNQIDLILLDVMMPGMDGFEVTRRVRQDNTHRLLPIILVTVLRETEDRVRGIEAGCDDFISHPVDKMELLARVRSLLQVKAYNDLMSNYRKELESEVTRRTEELEHAFIFQQRLIDALPVPVFYKDLEGKYLGCNRSFEKFFRQKREQIFGKSVDELSPTEFADIYHEKDRALLQNRGIQIYESVVKDTDGVVHNVIFHKATFLNMDGSVGGLIGAILDITDRKRAAEENAALQNQLRQSQKVEAIGQLAGGIAHDFNNLLTIIQGNSQLSLMDLHEGDPLRANIEEIRDAAKRAADLTRQLLAFSRKQILEMQVLDLNQVLQRLDKMLRRVIGEDIELTMFLPELIWKVKADPGQMEQVVMNLSVNARDAMPEGGKLTIETANVELDEDYAKRHIAVQPGRYVMLSVSDNGVGMSPEVRERIFEPFFTTKEKGKGTGLGLSTAYGIVKQSGGNIWVYSEPGQGTTLKIYLPQVDEPLEEMKEEVVKEISRGHETILIVEDEDAVRKLAVRVLKRQGYKVLEAPDGGKALMLCEAYKEPIHLILTDVVMPGMSGRKFADRLKAIHPEAKVLYMSGYTDNAILHHGILEPGTNFIQKPFTVENLPRKVREVLDKRSDSSA
jgi:two-component system cell cycle sensor histidine kinase/response regulator CckA